MAHPRPFKMWRAAPGEAPAVFAEGMVADDGTLFDVTVQPPFQSPADGSVTLTEMEAQAEKARAMGFTVTVELGDQQPPKD